MAQTAQRRPKPTNQPSQLLSKSENQQLFQIIGSRCVVIRLICSSSVFLLLVGLAWPTDGAAVACLSICGTK